MLNRATNVFHESAGSRRPGDRPWHVDQNPGLRIVWLFVLMALPLAVVAARLAHLQIFLSDVYAEGFDHTTVEYEPIPSADGRIVSTDGRVLAFDLERFNVSMHYRWLEEPANENWLKQQALSRLTRAERRDPRKVEEARRAVEERRKALWSDLARLTGVSLEQLAGQRRGVQERVERIVKRMHQRRQERLAARDDDAGDEASEAGWWGAAAWRAVVKALTTPPRRDVDNPLVAREELDYHMVVENVPLAIRAEIEAHPQRYPGLRIEPTTRRVYPESGLAPHVIGARRPLTAEEVAQRRERLAAADPLDYEPGDRMGRTGVERTYDIHLHGQRGLRKIVRDRQGEIISAETVRAPRSGGDVELTLQLDVQQDVEALLDRVLTGGDHTTEGDEPAPSEPPAHIPDGAALVAIDVHTGAVLVAASAPRFNLGPLATPDAETWQRINADPRRPMFHRAIQMALPPGSVFKTLTSVALIESRKIDPDAKIFCQGYLDRPDQHRCYIFSHFGIGHGDTDLSDALCRSCNVYFFEGARKIGPEPIVDWADRFGFGHPTGIDLPGEAAGIVPAPDKRPAGSTGGRPRSPWYPGDTLGLAIGQSRLVVTPLQVARMMATVANGGYLVTPYVARPSHADAASGPRSAPPTHDRRRIADLSSVTLERIREGLERVVADPTGTGHKTVHLDQVAIAGKTGTAEVGGNRPDHAWFAGYVPADRPRIAFAVVLEHAGSGGKAAGPVARQFVESLLAHGVLQPTRLVAHEEPARPAADDE